MILNELSEKAVKITLVRQNKELLVQVAGQQILCRFFSSEER